jgi:TPR repeat protein
MYDVGSLYSTGTGTEANAFEAAKWIGKAANEGHPEAEVEYAVILLRDHEVTPELRAQMHRRGAELLRSAAAKGIAVAQNRLARCYLQGVGVAKDAAEAAKWHLVAKAGGVEDEVLEKAFKALPAADRQKASVAAAEWREQTFLD